MTTFVVNGKERELRMDVNGIDISEDFIGNTSHGMQSDEDGRYIATKADFEWWQRVIQAHLEMEKTIKAYKETNDSNEVDRVVQDWIGVDLEDQPTQVAHGLNQVF